MMEKNVAGQRWVVFAYGLPDHASPGKPVTSGAGQITANLSKDAGTPAALATNTFTELEDGYYYCTLSQAETNADLLTLFPASSTAEVQVIAVPGAVYTRPANFNAMGIETDGGLTKVNTLDGHTAQTGDSFARIGATGSGLTTLATAAALTTVDTEVGNLQTDITAMKGAGFSGATDSLEAIRDRGDSDWVTGAGGAPPDLLQSTTIATLTSQTVFTLTAGSADNDAYANQIAVITDSATSTQKSVGSISAYVGGTLEVTLAAAPDFTIAVGDTIDVIAATGAAGSGATASEVWGYAGRTLTANTNLNDLDASEIRDAVGLAAADLDTQIATLATAAAVSSLNDVSAADVNAQCDIAIADALNSIADAILNRDLSAVSDTNARTLLNAARFLRNKWSVSGTTLTVTKEDDTTSAWTATVSVDANADPITGNDPA